jgi:hypothetical protein
MLGGTVEFAVNLAVTHDFYSFIFICHDGSSDMLQVGCLRSPMKKPWPEDPATATKSDQ